MKRRSTLLLCAILLVLFSCSPVWRRAPVQVDVSPSTLRTCIDLPPESRAEAHRAVVEWDKALGSWRHIVAVDVFNDGPDCGLWVHLGPPPNIDSDETLGWVHARGSREIILVEGKYEQDVAGILMHEMGHALGAGHVPMTLMDPQWSPLMFTCPDATTVAQVAAWHRVDLDTLSWCTP